MDLLRRDGHGQVGLPHACLAGEGEPPVGVGGEVLGRLEGGFEAGPVAGSGVVASYVEGLEGHAAQHLGLDASEAEGLLRGPASDLPHPAEPLALQAGADIWVQLVKWRSRGRHSGKLGVEPVVDDLLQLLLGPRRRGLGAYAVEYENGGVLDLLE